MTPRGDSGRHDLLLRKWRDAPAPARESEVNAAAHSLNRSSQLFLSVVTSDFKLTPSPIFDLRTKTDNCAKCKIHQIHTRRKK